jgi:hypothetical protein
MRKSMFLLFSLSLSILILNAQKKTFSFEEEIDFTAPLKLKVSTFEGNIEVTGTDKGNSKMTVIVSKNGQVIELTKPEFEQHFVFSMKKNGNSTDISTAINENEKKKYWKEEITVSYELRVPKETSCDLYTMKGNLEIKGLVENQKCITNEGIIKIEKTIGGLILETSSGNIFLKDIEGSVAANTSNGKIQGNINLPKDSVICKSDNGTINIIVPGTIQADVFLKGKLVNSSKVNFTGTFERTLVAGKLNGGGIPIRMTGTNGNVSLFYK